MQFMSSWTTEDGRTLLYLSESTIKTFHQYAQLDDKDCEAGGILIGSVHGAHMLVEQATTPTALDKRLRFLFERMPFGHESIALSRWRETLGTIRYLGEWHTHPQDDPQPSALDRAEWQRLSVNRRDKRPMLAVVVGRKSLYVELVSGSGCDLVLTPVE